MTAKALQFARSQFPSSSLINKSLRGNGVMDSALAFFAGGWGSIPLAGSKNLPIEMAFFFFPLGHWSFEAHKN